MVSFILYDSLSNIDNITTNKSYSRKYHNTIIMKKLLRIYYINQVVIYFAIRWVLRENYCFQQSALEMFKKVIKDTVLW